MIDPIDVLKNDCAEAFAENDRLRRFNAELLEAMNALIGAIAELKRKYGPQ